MHSMVIFYKRSYSTLLWIKQSKNKRFTKLDPLVLEFNLFNFQNLQQIETKLSHDVLNPDHVPL